MGGATLLGAGISYMGQKSMQKQNARLTREQLALQREQQKKLDAQRAKYEAIEFVNPYTDMENPFEDLTVNQQQAQFQAQLGSQQRADILQGLRGAAGTSGVAGLAQSLANQQQIQAQQISASIGQQEARNQLLTAKGAAAADMAERGGEAMVQQAEMSRQSTLLGVEYGQMAGANAGVQQAYANEMQGNAMAQQMLSDRLNMVTNTVGQMAQMGMFSGGSTPQPQSYYVSGNPTSNINPNMQSIAFGPQTQQTSLLNQYNFGNQIPYRP
tara:strand:+ start:1758 stop:2567 length:810 start_codon:yes stop_codon:yes gene_type:complete